MKLKGRKSYVVVMSIILVGLAWWLCRPRGVVQPYIDPGLAEQAHVIDAHMRHALARTRTVSTTARKLLLVANRHLASEGSRITVATKEPEKLGDVLEALATLEHSEGPIEFTASLDFGKLLSLLYRPVGFVDHRLVVHRFDEKPSKSGTPHFRAFIQFVPHDGLGRSIPGEADETVPLQTFIHLSTKYIIETLEETIGDRDCERLLCVSELPDSLARLEATVDAFEFLSKGRADSRCRPSESDEACIRRIVGTFVKVLDDDVNNNFARLGLGLAKLQLFKVLLPRTSSVAAGRLFMEGLASITSATEDSQYLGGLLATKEWQEYLRQTPGLSDFAITQDFIRVADNYRAARRAFVRADYKATVHAIAKLKKHLPEPAKPHVRNLELTAKLFVAPNASQAKPLIEEFAQLPVERRDGSWHATYALLLSLWNNEDTDRINTALTSIDLAIEVATDSPITRLDRIAQKGMCLALIGRKPDALIALDVVQADLSNIRDNEAHELTRLFYNLGVALSLVDKQHHAAAYLRKAAMNDSIYLDGISHMPLLSSFRDWEGYSNWKTQLQVSIDDAQN